jgi:DNA-binding response OmpR family regulator
MATPRTILLIDDDEELREALADQFLLYDDEFAILQEATAQSGVKRARDEPINLILLDVDLPDMDGREVAKLLRKHNVTCPIIMLTGQTADADQVLGLEAGANDYVTKPFRFQVLLARVRAHLRSHEQSEDAVFTVGPYTFHPAMKTLNRDEKTRIRLTEKETNILKYLYRAAPKPVGRDELLHEVWGYNSGVTTHTLETHVYRLRQKIEPNPSDACLLVTEAGGYRLIV